MNIDLHGEQLTEQFFAKICSAVFIFSLLLNCSPEVKSQTGRWVYIAESAADVKFYIDKNSIKKIGDLFYIWDKSVYPDGSFRVGHTKWDCAKKRFWMTKVNVYSSRGILIEQVSGSKEVEVTPDTPGEAMLQAVCGTPLSTDTIKLKNAEPSKLRVIVNRANIREASSMDSPVLLKVKKGTIIQIAEGESKNGWYEVLISKDKKAWIHGNTVEIVED